MRVMSGAFVVETTAQLHSHSDKHTMQPSPRPYTGFGLSKNRDPCEAAQEGEKGSWEWTTVYLQKRGGNVGGGGLGCR